MNKSNMTGWKNVFYFSFSQSFKGKAIRIMTMILFVVALFSTTIMNLVTGAEKEKTETSIKEVYVLDESELNLISGLEVLKDKELYQNIQFVQESKSLEERTTELEDAESDTAAILLYISYSENIFNIQMIYGDNTDINKSDVENLSQYINEQFTIILSKALSIDDSKIDFMNAPVEVEVEIYSTVSEEPGSDNADDSEGRYGLAASEYQTIFTLIMVLVMILAFSGEGIAAAIVTEKSTRVIEYILTSVKPMAIVVGKVLSVLSIIIIQALIVLAGVIGSTYISNAVFGKADGNNKISNIVSVIFKADLDTATLIVSIIIIVIMLILGLIFFGMMAGVAGASVSKMEELTEGVKIYSTVLVICAYVGIGVVMVQNGGDNISDVIINILLILPFTSPFLLPGYLLIGKATIAIGLISLAVMLLSVYLITKFVASIYEYLIYHNGAPLKITEIIKLAKGSRKGAQ